MVLNIFSEIVALQVYQSSKNYDQTDLDMLGSRLLSRDEFKRYVARNY
jgi:hypothetical protein